MKFAIIFSFFFISVLKCASQQLDGDILLINVEHIDRGGIANVISIVNSLNPKVIAIDLQFDVSSHYEKDAKLANALWKCKNVVMADLIHDLGGNIIVSSASQAGFISPPGYSGFVNTLRENDSNGTVKRFTVWEQESMVNGATGIQSTVYHFAVRTAMTYDSLTAMEFVKSHPKIVDVDYRGGKRRFKKYTSKEVLVGKLTRTDVQGKIVMLGFLGPGNEDKLFTPLNNNPKSPDMYGVEYLANIVAQVLEHKK